MKESKLLSLYIKPELIKKIERYWHKSELPNRNQTILMLIERGLESVGRDKDKKS